MFQFVMKVSKKFRAKCFTQMEGYITLFNTNETDIKSVEQVEKMYSPVSNKILEKVIQKIQEPPISDMKYIRNPNDVLTGENPGTHQKEFELTDLPTEKLLQLEKELKSKGLKNSKISKELETRSLRPLKNIYNV